MRIILTAAEHAEVLRQLPGPIYFTVEGDSGCIGCFDRWTHAKIHGNDKWLAPSRFVKATGPCETCGGDGLCSRVSCPSCKGTGIKQVELRVTCPDHPGNPGLGYPCPTCGSNDGSVGSVLFAHCSVEVLPVVDALEACRPRNCLGYPHCDGVQCTAPEQTKANALLVTRGPCWLNLNGVAHRLNLDPLPVPGRDWIVVLDGLTLS